MSLRAPRLPLLLLIILTVVGGFAFAGSARASAPLDTWDALLAEYRTDDGGFRYQSLLESQEDLGRLRSLVEWVGSHTPAEADRNDTLAFRINAYNILVVRAVLEAWPLAAGGVMSSPGFFDGRTHTVSGTQMTLNALENEHIRAAFGEPRIHFVVNCASTGCPPLAPQALRPSNLEQTLDTQTRRFLRDNSYFIAIEQRAELSQLFEWFASDFEASGGVRAFVARYIDADQAAWLVEPTTSLTYRPYDWSLNAR